MGAFIINLFTEIKTWAQQRCLCMCHDAFAKLICELTHDFLLRRETCLHDSLDHRKKVDKGDKDLNSVCSRDKCERKT